MAENERARIERLQKKMGEDGLDALVCRLSENVVYLTDYWPHHGFSFAVLPREGKPLLFVPEVEIEYTKSDWAEVTPFGWGLLKDGDLYANYRRLLSEAIARLGLKDKKVGVERSFEIIAPTYRAAEPVVPSGPWQSLMDEVFAGGTVVDITDFLQNVRSIKTDYELRKMRIANEIAEMGMLDALSKLAPGLTEVQIGAMVEYKIRADGPGYKGARLVRAEAEVGAGPVGSFKGTLLVPSTGYSVAEGDLVMIELATQVDGYFSDLTYMGVVGTPNERQRGSTTICSRPSRLPPECFARATRSTRLIRQRARCWRRLAWGSISCISPVMGSDCATTNSSHSSLRAQWERWRRAWCRASSRGFTSLTWAACGSRTMSQWVRMAPWFSPLHENRGNRR